MRKDREGNTSEGFAKKEKKENKESEEGKKEQEDKKDSKKNENEPKEKANSENQQGKLSPQQIKNLLEAMNNEENKVQEKMNASKTKGIKIETDKDW